MTVCCEDVVFRGRVQGVGFRFTPRRVARGFAVAGWVRTEPDGSVRCVVEGDGDEVDRFVEAVREAMRGNVTGIERQPAADAGGFETFEIRY